MTNDTIRRYKQVLLTVVRLINRADPKAPFDIVNTAYDTPRFHVIYRCASEREAEEIRDRVAPVCRTKRIERMQYGSHWLQYYLESKDGDVQVSVAWRP